MHYAKLFNIDAPTRVVNMTTTTTIVVRYFLSSVYICKHNAKAITPRTNPEYQHIFSYLSLSGNPRLRQR